MSLRHSCPTTTTGGAPSLLYSTCALDRALGLSLRGSPFGALARGGAQRVAARGGGIVVAEEDSVRRNSEESGKE